jgi:hypothetical protein
MNCPFVIRQYLSGVNEDGRLVGGLAERAGFETALPVTYERTSLWDATPFFTTN